MKLIIGLGNPGKNYVNTRHNIGWQIIDYLKEALDFPEFKLEKKFQSVTCSGIFKGKKIILAKPQTFMNGSGKTVGLLKNYYKIKSQDIIIVRDDLDLAFGKYRQKDKSGSGGHQGVNSILAYLKTNDFIQIKVGIRNEEFFKMNPADFVLKKFTSEERKKLKELVPQFVNNILKFF